MNRRLASPRCGASGSQIIFLNAAPEMRVESGGAAAGACDARASAAMSALHCDTASSIVRAEPSATADNVPPVCSTNARYDGIVREWERADPAVDVSTGAAKTARL